MGAVTHVAETPGDPLPLCTRMGLRQGTSLTEMPGGVIRIGSPVSCRACLEWVHS